MAIAAGIYEKALKRDDYRCARCWTNQELTLHHIIHRCNGGTDCTDNLCCLCFSCHRNFHKQYDRNPDINFWVYLAEGGILTAIREHNEERNLGRQHTICKSNDILEFKSGRQQRTRRRVT